MFNLVPSSNSLFQQANFYPHDFSRQLEMHHDSLYARIYNKDKTSKISEIVDFCAKFNEEIYIHMANLTSGLKMKKQNKR